jgi:ABC transporter substrate binding protein (PQQ-dependent alcohol dehydrogenase system)
MLSKIPFLQALTISVLLAANAAGAAEPIEIRIGYLHPEDRGLTISLVERPPEDTGLAGALLAIADNDTTGQFTGQSFELSEVVVSGTDGALAALDELEAAGASWVVADLDAEALLAVADEAAGRGMLVFNVGATDDRLRIESCRENIIHVAPSRAMLADALGQYLVWKQWQRWFLVEGSHPEDQLFADAIRRAAQRFGATIVEERRFEDTGGARTTDSGHVQVQRRMPVFTQAAAAHDVLIVADENEVFGAYIPFRTWDPRPVAGHAGLVPTAWSPAHEQWGGVQIQNRFLRDFGRGMRAEDMLAWTAVRMIGEAATRTGGGDPDAIEAFLKGPDFSIAAFKGQKLTLRDWNQQLRQPILLADGRTVVSVSPQEGFLHQTSELDTLGYDRPESECRLQEQR